MLVQIHPMNTICSLFAYHKPKFLDLLAPTERYHKSAINPMNFHFFLSFSYVFLFLWFLYLGGPTNHPSRHRKDQGTGVSGPFLGRGGIFSAFLTNVVWRFLGARDGEKHGQRARYHSQMLHVWNINLHMGLDKYVRTTCCKDL